MTESCNHPVLFKGTHPSFVKGCWLCRDCEMFVETDLHGYAVVLMAVKKEDL